MPFIDLYSDTKTRPTAAMRAAIAAAEVGDEQGDEDVTTLALCEAMAGLLGMEAGIFMPSGTMCNLVAVLVHTRPGDELIAAEHAHIVTTEAASAAVVGGVAVRALQAPHGLFEAAQVEAAVRPRTRTAPRSALLVIEQTTFSCGAVWPLAQLRAVRDAARAAGLNTHVDGARLLNATAASGVAASDYVAGCDSAWIDLSKGLGCPVGAVLCGSHAFIREAWQWKYRLGGAMRQSGVLAAAGLYALEHHVARLKDDNAHARAIAKRLSDDPSFQLDPAMPASNMLRFRFPPDLIDAQAFAAACLQRGVRVRPLEGNVIRVTTHLDVSAAQAAHAAQVMVEVARAMTLRPAG